MPSQFYGHFFHPFRPLLPVMLCSDGRRLDVNDAARSIRLAASRVGLDGGGW